MNKKTNEKVKDAIVKYLKANNMFQNICIYTNGKVYSSEKGIGLTYDSENELYIGEIDVESILEHCNPTGVSMTFEGVFHELYNEYGKIYDEFDEVVGKYGLYPEQWSSWSLALYEK